MKKSQLCERGCEPAPCVLTQFGGSRASIRALCFHPNLDTLFSGDSDGFILKWNYRESESKSIRLGGHTGAVNDISLTSNGELLVSASNDSTVRVWVPIVNGQVLEVNKAHKGAVLSTCFSPTDSSIFATCAGDKLIKIWSVNNFKSAASERKIKNCNFLQSFKDHKNWVRSVRFSKDGKLLCSASDDKTVKIYDLRQKTCAVSLINPAGASLHAEFNPCGTSYVGVTSESNSFLVFDVRANSVAQYYPNLFSKRVNGFCFHPSGDFAVCVSEDAQIKVLDLNEARPLYTLYAAREGLNSVAFTSDGCLFATGGNDKQILIWEHSMIPYSPDEEVHDGEIAGEYDSTDNPKTAQFFNINELETLSLMSFNGSQ